MPTRAPASMAMLHMVMRPSIDRSRMALPANSMAWPLPPAVPILPMMASTMSLAVTPAAACRRRAPACSSSSWRPGTGWPARARLPRCRCHGPAHRRRRGWRCASRRRPRSCPAGWRPAPGRSRGRCPGGQSFILNSRMPKSSQLSSRVCTWMRDTSSAMASRPPWRSALVVGTLWSGVAMLASMRHGLRPARRRPSKAWGEVTSWRMWRSM